MHLFCDCAQESVVECLSYFVKITCCLKSLRLLITITQPTGAAAAAALQEPGEGREARRQAGQGAEPRRQQGGRAEEALREANHGGRHLAAGSGQGERHHPVRGDARQQVGRRAHKMERTGWSTFVCCGDRVMKTPRAFAQTDVQFFVKRLFKATCVYRGCKRIC